MTSHNSQTSKTVDYPIWNTGKQKHKHQMNLRENIQIEVHKIYALSHSNKCLKFLHRTDGPVMNEIMSPLLSEKTKQKKEFTCMYFILKQHIDELETGPGRNSCHSSKVETMIVVLFKN